MEFDRGKIFNLCYYGQVNSLRQKSSAALKWARKTFGSNIYFAGNGTINSKINGTIKGVNLAISILRSILAEVNLLAHNIIILWFCYYEKVNSLRLK